MAIDGTIQIETSLGILEIPLKAIDNDLDNFMEMPWYHELYKLYKFHKLTIKGDWLKIHLDDEFYGEPEYKLINKYNGEPDYQLPYYIDDI